MAWCAVIVIVDSLLVVRKGDETRGHFLICVSIVIITVVINYPKVGLLVGGLITTLININMTVCRSSWPSDLSLIDHQQRLPAVHGNGATDNAILPRRLP